MELTEYRTRITRYLQDTAAVTWNTDEIDDGLRFALAEFSETYPQHAETVITCPGAGREIAIDSIEGLTGVTRVWWPYDSTAEAWPPNQVAGWKLLWDDGRPVLFLSSLTGNEPQANDEIRIWYVKPQTINGLDGAAVTTLQANHENLIVIGSAGFAAQSKSLTLGLSIDRDKLDTWGYRRISDFRRHLSRLDNHETRRGEPWGGGWQLDKWAE
ncbi:MAG: hypothetical protein ACOYYS_19275 [Chloroflexota bacterium]